MAGRINPIIQAWLAAQQQATQDYRTQQQGEQFRQKLEEDKRQADQQQKLQEQRNTVLDQYYKAQIDNQARLRKLQELETGASLASKGAPTEMLQQNFPNLNFEGIPGPEELAAMEANRIRTLAQPQAETVGLITEAQEGAKEPGREQERLFRAEQLRLDRESRLELEKLGNASAEKRTAILASSRPGDVGMQLAMASMPNTIEAIKRGELTEDKLAKRAPINTRTLVDNIARNQGLRIYTDKDVQDLKGLAILRESIGTIIKMRKAIKEYDYVTYSQLKKNIENKLGRFTAIFENQPGSRVSDKDAERARGAIPDFVSESVFFKPEVNDQKVSEFIQFYENTVRDVFNNASVDQIENLLSVHKGIVLPDGVTANLDINGNLIRGTSRMENGEIVWDTEE